MSDKPVDARGEYTLDEFEQYDLMGNNSDEEDQDQQATALEGISGISTCCGGDNSGGVEEPRGIVPTSTVKEAIEEEQCISSGGDGFASEVENRTSTEKRSTKWLAAAQAVEMALAAAESARAAAEQAAFAVDMARDVLAAVELEERRKSSSGKGAEIPEHLTSRVGQCLERDSKVAVSSSKAAEVVESILEGEKAAMMTPEVEAPAASSVREVPTAERVAKGMVGKTVESSQAVQDTNQRTRRPRGGNLGARCYSCDSTRAGHQRVRKPSDDTKRRRGKARPQRSAVQLVDWSVAPDSVWVCTECISKAKKAGMAVILETEISDASVVATSRKTTDASKARVRRKGGSAAMRIDTYRDRLGARFQATNLPEVGTVEPEDTEGIFQQVWDPVHSFSSDPVDPAANVDALLAEFAGVVSRDKCLEILYKCKGDHAIARQLLNNLRGLWVSPAGTAAVEQTARARVIVSSETQTRISTGCGWAQELEKSLAANAPALRRQMEGGVTFSTGSMNGMQADLNLSKVFSQQDEDRFVRAMLVAVNDYSMPMANIFSRVQDSFPDRQLCEVIDFYRVWKKMKTPAYEDFKKIRRLRKAACAVCQEEIVQRRATELTVCSAFGCSAVIHRECGKATETTTRTNKRKKKTSSASRENEKLFCCESCWDLANPAAASSSSTMATAAAPTASSPRMPPSIERNQTCMKPGYTPMPAGTGCERKGKSSLEARRTVSPAKMFGLSQHCNRDRGHAENEQALGGAQALHGERFSVHGVSGGTGVPPRNWRAFSGGSGSNLGKLDGEEERGVVTTCTAGLDGTERDIEMEKEEGKIEGSRNDPDVDSGGGSDEETETDPETEGGGVEHEFVEIDKDFGTEMEDSREESDTETEKEVAEDSREESDTETEKEVVEEGFQNGATSSDDY